jgi:DNA polymerase I-like protein with 3'-5' exonuclease and polymerase domains
MVAREWKSRRLFRCWLLEAPPSKPPFATGPDVLVVAYFASAEMGCYQALGWEFPRLLLDLFPEFRITTNGEYLPAGNGLLGAMRKFELDAIEATKKEAMRDRILASGSFDADEQRAVLDYCQTDVDAAELLFRKLIDGRQDLNPALWRGEFIKTVARMEWAGVPVDMSLYNRMVEHWPRLQTDVIDKVNESIPVYENRVFRMELFERWLESQGLLQEWPQTPAGLLATDDDTFKEKAELYPAVEPLRLARQMTDKLEKLQLTIGDDGRNRCLLSPFNTKTGRNAPSTTKFIFNTCSFLRNLIQPPPGRALAYVDWEQQEFAIAARLSGDLNMQHSYESGDPYLALAKLTSAVPADATRVTHPMERERFKVAILATQFQSSENGLAYRLGVTLPEARHLLAHHHRIYARFWQWSDAVCDYAQIYGQLTAAFGWKLHLTEGMKIRTLRNFPMQANGAEMMRLACVYAAKAGVSLVAPVHDALCIEASEDEIDHAVWLTQKAMRKASELVLHGFPLRSKAEHVIHYPQHFPESRGAVMWSWIQDQCSAFVQALGAPLPLSLCRPVQGLRRDR